MSNLPDAVDLSVLPVDLSADRLHRGRSSERAFLADLMVVWPNELSTVDNLKLASVLVVCRAEMNQTVVLYRTGCEKHSSAEHFGQARAA